MSGLKLHAAQDSCGSGYLVPLLISFSHMRRLNQLPVLTDHKDPFDRLIAAQALSKGLPLATADDKLKRPPMPSRHR
jgi:PIN domain nuclease of toxin-antitoxin system